MPTLMSQIEVESQSSRNFDSYRRSRIEAESKSNRNCNSRFTRLRSTTPYWFLQGLHDWSQNTELA